MKKALHILAAVAAACSALGGLDLKGIINILPENVAGVIAILPVAAIALGHVILLVGDYLDDGKKNDSFGKLSAILLPLLLAVGFLTLQSCTGVISGLTGQPVASVAVLRLDEPTAEPFQVATVDVLKAEVAAQKAREAGTAFPVSGLYDVGTVVDVVAEVVDSGK
ncbi:hypothetical protein HNR46_001597 [Haloferula luteola]|uniref:Uncharacterized protein n=1 Tax=Haloferula luteola TaxID=595692 RepID=A0A840VEW7_9BACT|nr:hypothetical protein [Haloferula luteola]MBB5351361.1 hypothetical protein [Haloferula luteola]